MSEFDQNYHSEWSRDFMSPIQRAMEAVGQAAVERYREARRQWEHYYEVCTIEAVVVTIQRYLAQFDMSGRQVRNDMELGVSTNLAEALRRAVEREGRCSEIDAVQAELTHYNDSLRAHLMEPDSSELAEMLVEARLSLAAAVLSLG